MQSVADRPMDRDWQEPVRYPDPFVSLDQRFVDVYPAVRR